MWYFSKIHDTCIPLMMFFVVISGSEISTDDRSYLMHLINAMDVQSTNVFFYPRLLPFVSSILIKILQNLEIQIVIVSITVFFSSYNVRLQHFFESQMTCAWEFFFFITSSILQILKVMNFLLVYDVQLKGYRIMVFIY